MTDSCSKDCANSRELREMIEEVADQAATRAAESVAKDMQIRMLELEQRLERNFSAELDKKLVEHFGMTPQEHAIEHDRMKKLYDMWNGFANALGKKVFIAIVTIALTISATQLVDFKAVVTQKPEPVVQKGGKNETDN